MNLLLLCRPASKLNLGVLAVESVRVYRAFLHRFSRPFTKDFSVNPRPLSVINNRV